MKILLIVLAVCVAIPFVVAILFFASAKVSNSAYKKVNADLSDSYFIKEGKVYYSTGGNLTFVGAYELFGSDAGSFRVLGETVAVDKDRVYFGKMVLAETGANFEEVNENELQTIEAHPELLAANKTDLELYFYTHSKTGKKHESTFLRDKTKVYAYPQLLDGAKPDEFQALSYNFGYDQQNVYHGETILAPYEGQPIRVEHNDWEENLLFLGETVFIGAKRRNDIDSASYKTIANKHSVDKNTAYFERRPIKNSDPSSYQIFNNSEYHSKDDHNVYFSGVKLHNADPKTFKLFGEYGEVAADKNHFYIRDVQVLNQKPGVDFRLSPISMDSYKYQTLHVTDNTALVVSKDILKELNSDSAIVVYDNKVYDRFRGQLKGADPSDLKVLEENRLYTRSGNKIYYEATEMKGAVPQASSIHAFDSELSEYAETEKYLYFRGEQITVNGEVYEHNNTDGPLQTFKDNNLVCNNRHCFIDEKLVLALAPADAANITYEDMSDYVLEE